MKTVKTFTNLAEAGFAASLLEAAGIPASLAGEQSFLYVAGIANEGVRLQVEDADHEQAMRILQEGLDAPPPPPATESAKAPENTPSGIIFALVVAYALLGFAIYQAREEQRTRPKRSDSQTVEQDYNGDGRPDHFYTYRDGALVKGEADRNFDGKIDEWDTFNSAGRITFMAQDQNFDGRPDQWYFFENGEVVRSEQDTDFNGTPDVFSFYQHGVIARSDFRPNGSKVVQRRMIYLHGVEAEEWVDEDGDGKFDYKIPYDPFGKPGEKIPVGQKE